MTKRVLVTGKNGQLGQSLQKLLSDSPSLRGIPEYLDFHFVGREALDLSSCESIADYFVGKSFDAILNCAAYTAVDKAESEQELADQINHLAVAQLAKIAKQREIPLIHISTDYVFNGQGLKPYVETDDTGPQNVYGLTKLKGEQVMLASGCAGAIIRTSWVYSKFGNNFVTTMLRLGRDHDSLNVIFDQVGSPTYAMDLAQAALTLLRKYCEDQNQKNTESCKQIQHDDEVNIYHYSNEGVCSWYDFAKVIFEFSGVSCVVKPIESKDYPALAKRPYCSLMNKAQIKHDYPDLTIPYWRDSLEACLKELEER